MPLALLWHINMPPARLVFRANCPDDLAETDENGVVEIRGYNDFDINFTHPPPLSSTSVAFAVPVPRRVVDITLFDTSAD